MLSISGGLLILAALATAAPVEERFVPIPHSGIEDKRFVPIPHSGIEDKRFVPLPHSGIEKPRAISLSIKRKLVSRGNHEGHDHSETIHNWHNNVFTVDIDIGTPKQTFQVQLDTGSNGLWVWSDTCPNECPTAKGFVRSDSSSYSTSNATFDLNYVVTDVQGQVGKDTIAIGDYVVSNQEFGVTLNATGTGFAKSSISGILGFSFPAAEGAFPQSKSWWANAISEWPEPIFGIGLTRTPDRQPLSEGGKLTLGGVDHSAFNGALRYIPCTESGGWKIQMESIKVNGKALGGANTASIDSGTTGLMGPLEVVAEVYKSIPGAFKDAKASTEGTLEYYRYPCEQGPDVALAFGGVDYQLNKDDLWIFKNKHNESSAGETCLGNVFGWDHKDWVVGNAFMNSVYTAFRKEPRGIAFAPYKKDKAEKKNKNK